MSILLLLMSSRIGECLAHEIVLVFASLRYVTEVIVYYFLLPLTFFIVIFLTKVRVYGNCVCCTIF